MRKKMLVVVLMLAMFVFTSAYAQVQYENSTYTVYVDMELVDASVIEIDGIPMLPVKKMCDILGYNIEVNGEAVTITEGENCKNSKGATEKITFTIGDSKITHISKQDYENETETFPKEPMTYAIDDEIYINSYYFCRVFDLNSRNTGGEEKIAMNTRNYSYEHNSPEYAGYVRVDNHDEKLEITIDGEKMNFTDKPFIDESDRVQIPVREFCESIGYKVSWDEEAKLVSISADVPDVNGGAGGDSYFFVIGEARYRRNGVYFDMDTEAQIVNDRTYVPLRYLAEMMGYAVYYNPGSHPVVQIGYDYLTLNSYLGKPRELVLKELGLDEDNIVLDTEKSKDYRAENVIADYRRCDVTVGFYNDVMIAFYYYYPEKETAYEVSKTLLDYYKGLYGETATYPLTNGILSEAVLEDLQTDEPTSHYDEWNIELPDELIKAILGDNESKMQLMLRLQTAPELSTVTVSYRKDLNSHLRN